jgi:transposase-like protein
LITMAMIGKIRRMYHRQGKSVREISRIRSLSRNTIRKWLDAPLNCEPKYRRGPQASKLTPFHEALKRALKADAHRPKKERRTALALYEQVKAAGYPGCYSRVTDFIRAWRQREGKGAATKPAGSMPLVPSADDTDGFGVHQVVDGETGEPLADANVCLVVSRPARGSEPQSIVGQLSNSLLPFGFYQTRTIHLIASTPPCPWLRRSPALPCRARSRRCR